MTRVLLLVAVALNVFAGVCFVVAFLDERAESWLRAGCVIMFLANAYLGGRLLLKA